MLEAETPGKPCVSIGTAVCLLVEEAAQVIAAGWMTQLAQGLGLDLTDSLAGDVELLADLFQRVVGVHIDAEAHAEYLGFTGGEAGKYFAGRFLEAVHGR